MDYNTIRQIVAELQKFVGTKVIEVFSQEKNTLVITFFDGTTPQYLLNSSIPNLSTFFHYKGFVRAKNNVVDLGVTLLGDTLQDISVVENDRIVIMRFTEHTAILHLFSSTNSNFFLCNKINKIVFSLHHQDRFVGSDVSDILPREFVLAEKVEMSSTSVSAQIKFEYTDAIIKLRKQELTKQMLKPLESERKKITRALSITRNLDAPKQNAERCRLFAELLLSQQNPKIRVGSSINLTDWENNSIEIPLDEKLTLVENAQKYFIKGRKAERELEVRKERTPLLLTKLNKIEQMIFAIKNAESIRQLRNINKDVTKEHPTLQPQTAERPQETKFRTFILDDNWTLYVGKNSKNNDELTMSFARPNDIWLHARGRGGSHCVLRSKSQNATLPKPILTKAAGLAAYYSQARTEKYTPVAYTQKKYVHKPRGAATGAVMMQREEVIMVTPTAFEEI